MESKKLLLNNGKEVEEHYVNIVPGILEVIMHNSPEVFHALVETCSPYNADHRITIKRDQLEGLSGFIDIDKTTLDQDLERSPSEFKEVTGTIPEYIVDIIQSSVRKSGNKWTLINPIQQAAAKEIKEVFNEKDSIRVVLPENDTAGYEEFWQSLDSEEQKSMESIIKFLKVSNHTKGVTELLAIWHRRTGKRIR